MKRSEFLKTLGCGTLVVCASCSLTACEDNNISPPNNVDFTLDLSVSPNTVLQNAGGFLYKSGIIIARLSATTFAALSQACTHEGTSVGYNHSQMKFICPNHGSEFGTGGGVIQGPATSSLKAYNTNLSGNMLRVFS